MALYDGGRIIQFKDGSLILEAILDFQVNLFIEHLVKDEETLFSIARKYYKETDLWYRIAEANPEIDPVELITGTSLIVPQYG